jgi:hypothetical protein
VTATTAAGLAGYVRDQLTPPLATVDGAKYSLEDSRHTGDSGWKDMPAPAG